VSPDYHYRNYENQHRLEVVRQLSAVVELKADELVQYRKERLDPEPFEPLANNPGRELGTIVRADMLRRAMLDKELGETTQDIIGLQTSF